MCSSPGQPALSGNGVALDWTNTFKLRYVVDCMTCLATGWVCCYAASVLLELERSATIQRLFALLTGAYLHATAAVHLMSPCWHRYWKSGISCNPNFKVRLVCDISLQPIDAAVLLILIFVSFVLHCWCGGAGELYGAQWCCIDSGCQDVSTNSVMLWLRLTVNQFFIKART